MQIEIAAPARMSQTGSSLLRLIQNNDMPLIDLLVRESVQNSLDAHRQDATFVSIDFKVDMFDTARFIRHLDGVEDALHNRYPDKRSSYIAISDTGTVGLTGPLHYDDVESNDYGNLLKLVYEICKPQESAGAGGSWGLGKTVYFRIGIGMVVYYSRILDDEGKPASRLAVSMVEDEGKEGSIIPMLGNKIKRGIAWWGEQIAKNTTRPVQDESTIRDILAAFRMTPYEGDATGTVIIIPFIDIERLLSSNSVEYTNLAGKHTTPYWMRDINEYVRIALQRWYAPRLDNPAYRHGPYLRAFVNGEECSCSAPLSALVQAMYNMASSCDNTKVAQWNGFDVHIADVVHRNLLEQSRSGRLAYVKLPRTIFREDPPDNLMSPFVYANCERQNLNSHPPMVACCRKPGMIVSYNTTGSWISGVQPTAQMEYIIALFVLDSSAHFKDSVACRMPVEEYVRQSELADHTSWTDITVQSVPTPNPRLVGKIKAIVSRMLSKEFDTIQEPVERHQNISLGKLFGDLLLPPESFGRQPSIPGGGTGVGSVVSKKRGAVLRINQRNVLYQPDGSVAFPFRIDITDGYGHRSSSITTGVAVENKTISAGEWENWTNSRLPFQILEVQVTEAGQGRHPKKYNMVLDPTKENMNVGPYRLVRLETKGSCWYGISLDSETTDAYWLKGVISVSSSDKTVKACFQLDVAENDIVR